MKLCDKVSLLKAGKLSIGDILSELNHSNTLTVSSIYAYDAILCFHFSGTSAY